MSGAAGSVHMGLPILGGGDGVGCTLLGVGAGMSGGGLCISLNGPICGAAVVVGGVDVVTAVADDVVGSLTFVVDGGAPGGLGTGGGPVMYCLYLTQNS